MNRAYFVVDAFTGEPFTGNPAGVVLDTEGLDDAGMQSIAAEFNLSETTFVLPPMRHAEARSEPSNGPADAAVRFRWFTPTTEVEMCGHATLGGVHALVESGRIPAPADPAQSVTVRIETRSGPLTAFVERIPKTDAGHMIWIDLIDPTLTAQPLALLELAAVLCVDADAFSESALPTMRTQDRDVLVFVDDISALNAARPDFRGLEELLARRRLRGLCLATVGTLSPAIHVQSRFFAPTAGVDEDPVTGSVHGPLAAYLVKHGVVEVHDGLAGLTCVQAKAGERAGLVHALVQPKEGGVYSVRIGGQAITTMRGTLVC
jgi:PhzF family phenazine biosynthesis protein